MTPRSELGRLAKALDGYGNACICVRVPNQRFCSAKCRGADSQRKVTLNCLKCGGQFKRKPSSLTSKKGAGAFCSMDCKAAWMSGSQLTTSGVNRMTRRRGGKRDDLAGRYFRSSWEANWARYLNWLIGRGEVTSWEFEPDTFEFPVKRGSKFYTPDFKIKYPDGSSLYHEVKGWMDPRSATKLRRMAKHHPSVVIRLIDTTIYHATAKAVGPLIPNWEGSTKGKYV